MSEGSSGSLAIKPLEASDLSAAARLWFESWQSTGMSVALRETEATFQERIRRELARLEAYLALEGVPVGFLALATSPRRLIDALSRPAALRIVGRAIMASCL